MATSIRELNASIWRSDLPLFVRCLKENGVDVRDADGRTPLILSTVSRETPTEFARTALEMGANPSSVDKAGWSALHFASRNQQAEVVRLLLEAGADVDPQESFGNTPLMRCLSSPGTSADVVELLLEHGASPLAENKTGHTPLSFAELTSRDWLVSLLKNSPKGSVGRQVPRSAVPTRVVFDGATSGIVHFEEASDLWNRLVPARGVAETVQGELLRAVEKLRDEAHRNGNTNWGTGHRRLLRFVDETLRDSELFDATRASEISADLARIADPTTPERSDDPYDRLVDRIVEWVRAHPDPMPMTHEPPIEI